MAEIVKSLRLLADETRLRVLLLLRAEELSVVELQEILGMGQSRISNHLAQLRGARLVEDRRAGKSIYYRLVKGKGAEDIVPILAAAAREIPEADADVKALTLLLTKRQDKTREYFDQLAGKFGRTYCPGRSWQSLAHALFALLPRDLCVADLGAGEGTLSQLLAKRVRHVVAVDNSEKMVEFGRELATRHAFSNLEFRLGDLENPPIDPGSMDVAMLSQALHHAARPGRAVSAAAAILKPGGRIIILDLLAHQFEQARELYADTWLGFTESQLYEWMDEAGFRDIEVGVVSRDEAQPHFQTILATGVTQTSSK